MISFPFLILLPAQYLELPDEPGTYEMNPHRKLPDEEFYEFCLANPDIRIEQTALGKLIISSPAGLNSSFYEGEVIRQLSNWAIENRTGKAFSSSATFKLPDGSARMPDTAWVSNEKTEGLTTTQRKKIGSK